MENITIIGTGPAGLTAAIYAARAGHKPLILAGLQPGGQLTTTTEVENFPGFAEGIQGPALMKDMTAQAERVGARFLYEEVTHADFSRQPLRLTLSNKQEILSHTVIIATGATAKTLGLANEAKLMGHGLSTCATCDGFFYRNKKVMVVGGGDSAMEEASYLAKLCSEVLLVHRRAGFRASNIMVERAQHNPKIKIMTPFAPTETLFDERGLTGVRLQNVETGKVHDEKVDGLFYAIGHKPNSDLFRDYVDVDSHGYIVTTKFTATRTPGVFAAGDIADPVFKQAITAAGLGCQAAMQAAKFLEASE